MISALKILFIVLSYIMDKLNRINSGRYRTVEPHADGGLNLSYGMKFLEILKVELTDINSNVE